MSGIIILLITVGRRRHRWDLFDFVRGLYQGEPGAWIALGIIAGCIVFFVIYQKVTGRSFVKSKEERRAARRRRQHVLWEYRRGD